MNDSRYQVSGGVERLCVYLYKQKLHLSYPHGK